MELLGADDDLFAGLGDLVKTSDAAMKAMQQTLQRKQERENKKQRAEERLQQQQQELQTELETINDEGTMQEQQQKMEQMRVLVTEELDKGDTDAGGPEPDIYSQALFPVQSLPDLQLDSLTELQAALQQQQQLLGLPADSTSSTTSSDPQQLVVTFERLLSEGRALEVCPSEAAAQAVFRAVCFGQSSLARAAYTRFMSWCGEPEFVSGCELMGLGQMLQWAGGASSRPTDIHMAPCTVLADSMPAVTIRWLPSAADVLEALRAMGYKQQQQQEKVEGEDGAGAYRHGNMPLLLQLLGRVSRGAAAGRVDAGGLTRNVQQYQQLLMALLQLMLDERALLACRCSLMDAYAALLELVPGSAWDRLLRDTAPGSLLHALSAGTGPSHRSAVTLLGQMPRSARGTALRQLGALQLMSKLIPKAKQQVPPARISGMDPQQLRQSLHQEVRTLLGPVDKVRKLLTSLSDPPGPGGKLQMWLLTSVLEAADLVLWVDVSTPGVGISPELRGWLLEWLAMLDRVLDKKLSAHRVRNKVAAMENAYGFAELGCVVARGE